MVLSLPTLSKWLVSKFLISHNISSYSKEYNLPPPSEWLNLFLPLHILHRGKTANIPLTGPIRKCRQKAAPTSTNRSRWTTPPPREKKSSLSLAKYKPRQFSNPFARPRDPRSYKRHALGGQSSSAGQLSEQWTSSEKLKLSYRYSTQCSSTSTSIDLAVLALYRRDSPNSWANSRSR